MKSSTAPSARPQVADEIRALVTSPVQPRVSLYLPLRPVPNAGQNEVLARQAVEAAIKRLEAHPMSASERARFTELLQAVESTVSAQAQPVGSLAVFLDAGQLRMLPLAREVPFRVSVGRWYVLRPLLRALAQDVRYRALAVSVKRVSLFEGDARGAVTVPRGGLPASLEDALGSELSEKQLRMRGTAAGGGNPVYYSHDAASDEQKSDLGRFHHVLSRAVASLLVGDETPLVLVADVTHQAGLRAELRLPGLLAEGVAASPDHLSASEIHARTWPLVAAELARRDESIRTRYEEARNAGKALDLPDDVAFAAIAGRIRRLWLEAGRELPGCVDAASGRIVASEGDDALDSLAALVLARGGEVHVVEASSMPTSTGVAAELH